MFINFLQLIFFFCSNSKIENRDCQSYLSVSYYKGYDSIHSRWKSAEEFENECVYLDVISNLNEEFYTSII